VRSQIVKVRASEHGDFDCYLAMPPGPARTPAVVLASSIRGVDEDLRGIADAFAARGYIAAAPDLFWRTDPGPLARGDPRAAARAQPRLATIETGERDLADVLAHLHSLRSFNGRAAVMGFCYGGPYAILGPKRLGYHAGIACHGSQMLDYLADVGDVQGPVCLFWGDQDHMAPPRVRDAYCGVAMRMKNVDVQVLAGVRHGYMFRGSGAAFDSGAHDVSMQRAFHLLDGLRRGHRSRPLRP
jgi:carboxymethylenebutenolidase